MSTLQVLLLEDVEDDARLIQRALRAGGVEFSARRVDTREAFVRALREAPPDLILADYKLPVFDGASALTLAKEALPQVPVIIVTGALVDEVAVDLLRKGAADYILKDRLSRLVPAVRRALADAEQALAAQAVAIALRNSELRYRSLFESAPYGLLVLNGDDGTVIDVNPGLLALLGMTREELIGWQVAQTAAVKGLTAAEQVFVQLLRDGCAEPVRLALADASGAAIDVEIIGSDYRVEGKRFVQCNVRDIRERLAAERRLDEQLNELRRFQRVSIDRELRMQELQERLARLTGAPATAA